MWSFHWTESNLQALETLFCQNIIDSADSTSQILSLNIEKTTAKSANITLLCKGDALANKMYNKLIDLNANSDAGLSELANTALADNKFSLSCKINYESSIDNLLKFIQIIYLEITGFDIFKPHLTRIFAIDKDALKQKFLEQDRQFATKFQRLVENNMNPVVHASIRQCELAIRETYNYPAPHYRPAVQDEDEYDYDDEELEYEEPSIPMYMYDQREINLVMDLTRKLAALQNDLREEGFVEIDVRSFFGIDMVLSEYASRLISEPMEDDDNEDIDKARLALNVIAALRAVDQNGSHSRNDDMEFTQIKGYGLHNVVALLWHACKEAHAQNRLMPGVTLDDALHALAQGIADGARGNNRNFNVYDNLHADNPSCDQGKYNSLFSALVGVLPEIQIQYNYLEPFVIYLQNAIVNGILSYTADKQTAELFLDMWQGKKPEQGLMFLTFKQQINADFPSMIENFVTEKYDVPANLRSLVIEQIKKDIKEVENLSFGLTYIESVTPDKQMLTDAWAKKYNDQAPRKKRPRAQI